MKYILSILFIALLFTAPLTAADSTAKPEKATWYGFDEGLKEAKRTNKKIFVDVYTDWCGWCKKMDKEVFSEQYVLIRLNAEGAGRVTYKDKKSSETELARAFGVTGYPTALFLEPSGDLITTLPGYVKAEDFMAVLKYFGGSHYKTTDWQKYYEQYLKDNPPGSLK
jgi:thioredoxin-related protein